MFFILIILFARLTYLQVVQSKKLIKEGNIRSLRIQSIPITRGLITDRMGRLLAISIPAYSVCVDPQEVIKYGGVSKNIHDWTKLSTILSIPLNKLVSLISQNNTGHFFYLARQVDSSIYQCINQLKLPGVYLQKESKRYYPSGHITAHLIGITNIDNKGIEGVEKSFDAYLSGKPGTRIIRKDKYGRIVEEVVVKTSQNPKNIVLSIDEHIQYVAFNELNNAIYNNKAESGSLVLIDINTGEILAMVNSPSYNPNDLSTATQHIMRNRAITDVFEPGSTVKPIVIMAALQHKIIKENTVINTAPYILDGYRIKDVVYHDQLTVQEILQKSSNVGVSRLALAMPETTLIKIYANFGMGKATNIGLVGESRGIYPIYNRYMSNIERATFSYGYGLMITPLQLAKVYATIGGMGIPKPLSIVRINSVSMKQSSEKPVFPKALVRTVIDMMESISAPGNSGHKAAIRGYRVAVKTGTVKKVGSEGKYINQYVAYTVGIAPASDPRFALVVVINKPKNGHYYGGTVSAPVFSAVMGKTLKIMNVAPDTSQ
ncbi:peptidoglycan glycosyltransferase FtsI [Candidatus Blochmannia ocreatus]|uniref:Peptidoglycan D,D-transpeptidase FtsI n=2 Tax=Candidatus Blochmannia ocreatus (nom. nud.) TaxID=251538 RepID=A0ABY4SZF3_9ENTR|nr:peptidoglycan glycosyltransferase FtsI [Candidatus Blochmannia ocreatus]